MVWRPGHSSRASEFNSQYPYVGSQPTVTPALGELMLSSGLLRVLHTHGAQTNTHKHKKRNRNGMWGRLEEGKEAGEMGVRLENGEGASTAVSESENLEGREGWQTARGKCVMVCFEGT